MQATTPSTATSGRNAPDIDALIAEIAPHVPLAKSPIHGVEHWRHVATTGAAIAERTDADPHVVALFAVLHDAGRRAEGSDPDHGQRAAELTQRLQGLLFDLAPEQLAALTEACARHADGDVTGDATIGACWDADRLQLWRVGRVPLPAMLSLAASVDLIPSAGALYGYGPPSAGTEFFHGGPDGFGRGDPILPSAKTGAMTCEDEENLVPQPDRYRRDSVYVASSEWFSLLYTGGPRSRAAAVYEVRPLGPLLPDPTYPPRCAWSAESAEVIRRNRGTFNEREMQALKRLVRDVADELKDRGYGSYRTVGRVPEPAQSLAFMKVLRTARYDMHPGLVGALLSVSRQQLHTYRHLLDELAEPNPGPSPYQWREPAG